MSESKQNPAENYIEFFSIEQDTNIGSGYDQLSKRFSFDSYIINNNCGNIAANSIKKNSQNDLPKSGNGIDSEKKNMNTGIVPVLSKNPFVNKQTGSVLIFEGRKKNRLLVKRGVTNISLLFNDIALIYTKDKLVYVIDRDSKKYSIDKTLTELEQELDHTIFFRASRQYIININFIKSFKAYKKIKLLVAINLPQLEEPVVISQHIAPAFKKWMNDA